MSQIVGPALPLLIRTPERSSQPSSVRAFFFVFFGLLWIKIVYRAHAWLYGVRVRLKIIGNLETMHDSDLPTSLIVSLPIIFKRTVE